MTKMDYARLQLLSEKVINDDATMDEFVEFHQLLKLWNLAQELIILPKSSIVPEKNE